MTTETYPTTDANRMLDDLNPPQRDAVTHGGGPLLILAGAGSGKTRVITYRIAWLLANGVHPREILAVTFTNKAAGEMKSRVRELVGPAAESVWVSTFHSFAAKFLRFEHQAADLPTDFSIYDEDDSQGVLKRVLAEMNLPAKTFTPGVVKSKISDAKDQLLEPREFANLAHDDFLRKIAEIYAIYQTRLRDAGAVDFDDLILRTVRTLEENPALLLRWQERFAYVLVDEYQDTNLAQVRLIRLLAEPQRNLCVVGDDDQSIYAWRGADIKNILEFEKAYPEAVVVRLEQNYRSRPNILDAAHAVVSSNINRHPKKLWTEKSPGEQITLVMAPDDRTEAEMVIGRIRHLCQSTGFAGADCVVLYRTNAQSRPLEDACRRNSTPYVLVGGTKFYQRTEIKDALAYMHLTINGRDVAAWRRIINKPRRGIGDTSQEKLEAARRADGRTWIEFLADTKAVTAVAGARTAEAVKRFAVLMNEIITARASMNLTDWCHYIVEKVNLKSSWEGDDPITIDSRMENLDELAAALAEYEMTVEAPSLSGFLEQAALVTDIDQYQNRQEAVTLMTLHAAKGLEFPVVFITGLEEGLFPLSRSMETGEGREAERRLFYVGATRAKERLFLTYARMRMRFGPTASLKSRFIEEIPREYLEVENHVSFGDLEPGNLGYDAPARTWRPNQPQSVKGPRTVVRTGSAPRRQDVSLVHVVQAGTIIRHAQFGEGEVVAVHGSGDGTTCDVQFNSGFATTLMVRFAPLEIVRQ
ncbi:MAG: UvrD-helicase domain-containing protein [candidate division Zixibacteria bacterium]|nr:UvrD-helicase domain-containing protein [candidate division Zixibacteria bacterium]